MHFGSRRKSLRAILIGLGLLASVESSCAATTTTTTSEIQLGDRVRAALQSDPYFYDAHVSVVVQHGNVVLRGFVFSDWDLGDALRIATKAAQGARVINELTIEVGGRR